MRTFLGGLLFGLSLLAPTARAEGQEKAVAARAIVRHIIGHRGSCADRPENTLASARRAIEAGATAVEVDIRRTKDGQLVLLHDALLDRTTNGKGPVGEKTLEEIRQLDAGRWFAAKFAGEKVPTLGEVLTACRGKVDVMLDLKEQGNDYAQAVVAEVKAKGEPKRTIVGVRSVEQAKQFRRLLPEARQIGLIANPDDLDAYVSVGVGTIRLWPKWLSDASLVERVRWAGAELLLGAGTGKPDEVLPLLKYRPESMSSDDPARLLATLAAAPANAFTPPSGKPKIPIILDTDIGSDVDDGFALALALASPELDVRAVTTVGSQAEDRAWMVCRMLTQTGRRIIPVAAGTAPPKPTDMDGQIQYRRHPAVIFNRTTRPSKQPAVELMYSILKDNPGQVTIVAIGPLTNVAKLLEAHPDCRPWIKRLVIMGGAIKVGYEGKPPAEAEWNIATDVAAARRVLLAEVPLTVVPLDATATVRLERESREKLFTACTPLTFQVQSLYELWDKETPVLFDPVAVAAAFTEEFCQWQELRLDVDDKGLTRLVAKEEAGKQRPLRVAVSIDRERFVPWFVGRLTATGKPVLPRPPANKSTLVDRGNFPSRVHVVEDYDTDIEKRWWMSGKAEAKDVPAGGRRAQRAVLTMDFDDLQGDTRTMYRAVIFNPVPGPPMGPNTRLAFRYKLSGTDQLRVQLYSLTNGYHRYLSLVGLPNGQWSTATVDMTQMRRPDGTGGPLAADERIDDIQFYIDPRGELLIDDVILYDAAADGERRPFPQRVVFAGGFDTGRQGQEWPGDFEIVPHPAPLKWKYAKSIANKETNTPWLRVGLRGERRLDPVTELSFRYRLSGTDAIRVELRNSKTGWKTVQELPKLRRDEWASATVAFNTTRGDDRKEAAIDEVRFLLPTGSELGLDDLLLYTPAKVGR